MKKCIAFAVTMFAAIAFATADVTFIGARGILGLGVGTTLNNDEVDWKLDLGKSVDYGFALFAKTSLGEVLPVWEGLAAQIELGFTHKSIGLKMDTPVGEYKSTASFNAIDIPLLLAYDIVINDSFIVTPLFGPKFSIPVGKVSFKGDDDFDTDIDSKILFGLVFGASASFNVGPGFVVGDVRYDLGLNPFSIEDGNKLGTPRALLFSVGYQIAL